jgi:hypothetical protein
MAFYISSSSALYGCMQASKLWFEKLTKVFRREGYEHSPMDPFIRRQIIRDKIFLMLIYLDYVLIFADKAEIKRIEEFFKKEFTWITMNAEIALLYLGMQIMLKPRVVTIDMSYYRVRAAPCGTSVATDTLL